MKSARVLTPAVRAAALGIALGVAIVISWRVGGAESDVVARVGGRTITRQELDEQFARQHLPAGANADSARELFLESLVQKELLVLEARARGYFEDQQVTLGTRRMHDRLLQERMKEEEARADSTITEADLEARYKVSLSERKLAHIMHWSGASIDSARDRIDAGESFEKVATEMTIDAQAAEAGGVMPWLNDTVFPGEFLAVLDTMHVGGLAGPFKSRLGWHLMREDSIRTRAGADLAADRESLRRDLLGVRTRDHRWAALDDYRKRYSLQLDTTATVQTVTEAGAAYMAVAKDTTKVTVPMSERWVARDSTRILARYQGGTITTADYRNQLLEDGYRALYIRLGPAQGINDVAELFYQRVRILEGKRLGYDQDPEFKRRLTLKQEELAVERLYGEAVASKIKYTESDEKVYFTAHKEQFLRQEFYRCSLLDVDDASVAQGLVERMRGIDAVGFDSLKAELERGGHLIRGFRDTGKVWAVAGDPVLEEARTMKRGDVGHAVNERGEHSVFVLIDYQPAGELTFEEARENVRRTLYNTQSEEYLTALLADLETRYPVEKYPERLKDPQG